MTSAHKLIEHVMRVATRFVLAAAVMYQGTILNELVTEHWSHAEAYYHAFTAVDVVNCILLSACIWLAYFAIRWMKIKRKRLPDFDEEMSGMFKGGCLEITI